MLLNRSEVRRLEKAAREKDRKHLIEWAESYENQILDILRLNYEKAYEEEMQLSISNFITALAYTLIYTEEWQFKKENLSGFLQDLFATVDMFRTGEYKPQDYADNLKQYGFIVDTYDYTKVFKKKNEEYIKLAEEYRQKITEVDKLKSEYERKLEQLNKDSTHSYQN